MMTWPNMPIWSDSGFCSLTSTSPSSPSSDDGNDLPTLKYVTARLGTLGGGDIDSFFRDFFRMERKNIQSKVHPEIAKWKTRCFNDEPKIPLLLQKDSIWRMENVTSGPLPMVDDKLLEILVPTRSVSLPEYLKNLQEEEENEETSLEQKVTMTDKQFIADLVIGAVHFAVTTKPAVTLDTETRNISPDVFIEKMIADEGMMEKVVPLAKLLRPLKPMEREDNLAEWRSLGKMIKIATDMDLGSNGFY